MEFSSEDISKLFDEEETTNNIIATNNDITILFSVSDKTNSALAKIQCLPNGFNLNGKRSPSNTTHNVFVSDQLKIQLFKPHALDGSTLVCQLVINENIYAEKAFNELLECSFSIPRLNKGGSQGKSRVGCLKLVIQAQGEPNRLVGLSNNFWIRTKTRKEAVTNEKKNTADDKKLKREYEEDSESSSCSSVKKKKQSTTNIEILPQVPVIYSTNLVEENQELKKRIAELEKLVSDILTGKLRVDQNPITENSDLIQNQQTSQPITKPKPIPIIVSQVPVLPSNTFGMCSPTLMTSSCTSPNGPLSPTSFFITSPSRTGFESFDYPFDDMNDFF